MRNTREKAPSRTNTRGEGGRRTRERIFIKKSCRFCGDKNMAINYLDAQALRKFTTERGKILPSRITGTCARHQRRLSSAIKRSREIGLLPYVAE